MMREQLVNYINLMFAGNPEAEEIKQEILQNTLDRFDDLVASGKTKEAAYSLAIAGIGDLGEILSSSKAAAGNGTPDAGYCPPVLKSSQRASVQQDTTSKKLMRSIAIGLYIICAIPLFIFQNEVGLCLLLVIVAAATILMVMGSSKKKTDETGRPVQDTPQQKLRKSIASIVSTTGVIVYFLVSFLTGAWHITWLIFPIIAVINQLVGSIMDMKEGK